MYLAFLSYFLDHVSWVQRKVQFSALSVFLLMNAFYFTNIIPPIPLAIRDAGVYHSVQRSGSGYVVADEKESIWQKIIPGNTVHIVPGQPVYVFTSIFAPTELSASIVHHWQYYDTNQNSWVTSGRLSYRLAGGRQEGYRGYSQKSSLRPGGWRVDVETERGQILGRITFDIKFQDEQPQLIELIK
jgi:hypothetical protein